MTAMLTAPVRAPAARRPRRRRDEQRRLTRTAGFGLGLAMTWFSLLVLIPLAAVVVTAAGGGWATFHDVLTDPGTLATLRFTLVTAVAVTLVNAVMGTLIAWLLVRDRLPGRALLDLVIDIPFAMPTIVAGLVLLSLYGHDGPLGIDVSGTKLGVVLAIAFVTLPFVVRAVQPVLQSLETDVEEAASTLGASRATTLRRIVLPALLPAITAGASLSFARAISEYGSVVLISMNARGVDVMSTETYRYIEGGDTAAAAAVAVILLAIALLTIITLDVIGRKAARRD